MSHNEISATDEKACQTREENTARCLVRYVVRYLRDKKSLRFPRVDISLISFFDDVWRSQHRSVILEDFFRQWPQFGLAEWRFVDDLSTKERGENNLLTFAHIDILLVQKILRNISHFLDLRRVPEEQKSQSYFSYHPDDFLEYDPDYQNRRNEVLQILIEYLQSEEGREFPFEWKYCKFSPCVECAETGIDYAQIREIVFEQVVTQKPVSGEQVISRLSYGESFVRK